MPKIVIAAARIHIQYFLKNSIGGKGTKPAGKLLFHLCLPREFKMRNR